MKKIVLVFAVLMCGFAVNAQELDKSKAMELVVKNKMTIGLSEEDLLNSTVSNAYYSRSSGLTYVYLQQFYKSLPVFNQLMTISFKNDQWQSTSGTFINDISNKVNTAFIFPAVTPDAAVQTALKLKKINHAAALTASTLIPGRKYDFGKANIANENITAELLWVPVNGGEKLCLAWQIYLVPKNKSDYWMVRIDANSNQHISENNLTVYCNWDKTDGHHNWVSTSNFVMTKAANKKATVAPLFYNIFQPQSPSIVNGASYKVVKHPAESPSHPGGTPTIVTNPWTNAPGNATSLNWHSTGVADYIYTRGNNVWAQEDANGNNGTGTATNSTTTGDPLTFNFTPDFTISPSENATTPNQQFNVTNLFYWNNVIHDIMYQYGFDEVGGNFQSNNQGRGGAGNDYVLADAQDGSGTNNANFSTPADGGSGRMQMFLWNAIPTFTVNTPSNIAGQYQAVESNFSTANKLATVGQKTGNLVYYNDNAAGTTHEGCAGLPVNSVLGKIALIDRGNCNFTVKVKNAQLAGAIAAVVVNNVQGSPITMGGTDNTVTIPAIMVSINDGQVLKTQLLTSAVNVTMAQGQAIDGDVDNGVVCHEYAHGISNRLTGGPSQASCLGNAEQMGEGWSDYYGMMLTQDWAGSNMNTGALSPRGIGTYVVGQLPNQSGIRTQKYCTDFDINNKVYASTVPTETHDLGEIWCATLWDMTWNIIQQTGVINPNIYDATSSAGNNIALKLVTEGMKLQPCSPGFIDGRNAILKADSILYAGAYNCAIREAFRRRGMGLYASQGSSGSVTDQVADFTPFVTIQKNENIAEALEGQTVTYTTSVTSCSPVSNYVLRDTLPTNVTYVSGGTYNATNRVVSFPVDFTAGATQTFSFVVSVNAGSYFSPVTLLDEQITSTTVPTTLTASSTTANTWTVSTTQSQSAPNALFTPNAAVASDQKLETTNAIALGAGTSAIQFGHRYNTQAGTDGGIVEITTDNGTTWLDLSEKMTAGYYNSTLATGSGNPLAGRKAWSGNSNAFVNSSVNLSSFANQSVKLRFRFGSNNTTAGTGWYVDNILLKREPVVNIRSTLFDAAGARVSYSDTVTKIVQTVTCTNVAVNAQPNNISACIGTDVSFTVVADGTNPNYQWQVSSDGGNTYTNIAGANSATLTLTSVTTALNNNRYKVNISNACPSNATSTAAILTINTPANITTQPTATTACVGAAASFTVAATGSANAYQWQVSTDGGATFSDITGATGLTFAIPAVSSTQTGYVYRVAITSCAPAVLYSSAVILTVSNQASIAAQPTNTPACTGGSVSFSVVASGSALVYQWQVSTDGGITYNNIAGANSNSLLLNTVTSSMNNNRYRVFISNDCASNVTSNAGILIVSDPASVTAQPMSMNLCEGSTANFSVTATGTGITYQWQVSTDGGNTFTNIPGATNANLNVTGITASMNNNQYRAVLFSCSSTGLNSNTAQLTVNALANVSSQPADASACVGSNVTFSVASSGSNVDYQWQLSTDGGITYNNIAGATNTTLTLTNVGLSLSNNRYRAIVSNACPSSATSNGAVLLVTGNAAISVQPINTTVCATQNASFTSTAAGSAYQWQVSTDGGATFTDIAGANTTNLSIPSVAVSLNGNKYRLSVAGCAAASLISDVVTLTVNSQAAIATQPASVTTCEGSSASFNATTTGSNVLYQWQISTDGGLTFTNIAGATAATYTLANVTLSNNQQIFRVVVSNSCAANVNSNAATLTVNNQAVINAQPVNASGCAGTTAVFTSISSGPGIQYQWQVSADGGATFTNIAGQTSGTLTLSNITASMNNNQYRAIVSSTCSAIGSPSNAAVLTVLPSASISIAPADVNGCTGSDATFTVEVTGNNVGYQWQVSTDGGVSFTDITGATNSTLTLTNITLAMNNNKYRVVASSNPCGVTTSAASLQVLNAPLVQITANPVRNLYPGLTTTLTANSVPASSD